MSVNNYKKELNIEFFLNYAAIGDLKHVHHYVESKKVEVNDTKDHLTALSICAAKNGNIEVIHYLLNNGAEIRDAHLHAINGGNVEAVEALISQLSKNNNRNSEMNPCRDSIVFPPYMTPLMLAAIAGHRSIIRLLMSRNHVLPVPHRADCECDDCTVSSTRRSTSSQRNIDIYRAMCNPEYIALNCDDPITKSFELEHEMHLAIKNSNLFSHHYQDIFRKMEDYITNLINVTRDAEEVKVLIKQKDQRSNGFIKYPALQNAVDRKWKNFLASKQIENLRTELWIGSSKFWLCSGFSGNWKKMVYCFGMIVIQIWIALTFAIRCKKHITPQYRYLSHVYNETILELVLLLYLIYFALYDKFFYIVNAFLIIWIIGTVLNFIKKAAVYGLSKMWHYYGTVYEFVVFVEMIIVVVYNFSCNVRQSVRAVMLYKQTEIYYHDPYYKHNKKDLMHNYATFDTHLDQIHFLLELLAVTVYMKLLFLGSLRAYKGTCGKISTHLLLLAFCWISIVIPVFFYIILQMHHISPYYHEYLLVNGVNRFLPMLVFVIINLIIALTFELIEAPEKIKDKNWCYYWTARMIYDIHGSCEAAIPFNIFEIVKVIKILMRRVGMREHINEEEREKYEKIKKMVYSRYDCIKFLESK